MLAAGQLRPAAGEGVVDADRRRLRGGHRLGVRDEHLHPRSQERAASQRSEMLHADVVRAILVRVRALRFVVAADAEVFVREAAEVVAEAQRLVERDRVVHLAVHEQVLARGSQFQRLGLRAGGQHRVEVRRVVRIHPEDEQAERALVLDERAVQAAAKVGVALRSSRADERTACR